MTTGTPTTPAEKPSRRGLIACSRCRLLRGKCVHSGAPPCTTCVSASKEDGCVFPPRGTSLVDRAPRGIRKRKKKVEEFAVPVPDGIVSPTPLPFASAPPPSASASVSPGLDVARPAVVQDARMLHLDDGNVLPPHRVLTEGCEALFSGYFQISFVARPTFMHQLAHDPNSVSVFLLLSMLSISARFTPSLVARYGGRQAAVNVFAARAQAMMFEEMMMPSLERVQGFYLLGVCEWGRGFGFRSRMLQGLALQMADMIDLGSPDANASPMEIEVRRRTWWFLTMNTIQLGVGGPIPSSHDPVTAHVPLPSSEDDFTFGCLSFPPTYYPGAVDEPSLSPPPLSLAGAMVVGIGIWGRTARALCGLGQVRRPQSTPPPWKQDSLLENTHRELQVWLSRLSNKQKWSTSNLLAYKASGLDLGYFATFMNFHASHIAIRRQHLPIMIKALHPSSPVDAAAINGEMPPGGLEFWRKMASAMVDHALDVIELTETVSQVRVTSAGRTPFMAFAVYLAGSILNYLRVCPWLCPSKAPRAGPGLTASLDILRDFVDVWPVSQRWFTTLSIQAGLPVPDHTLGSNAHELASDDLQLDTRLGIYRQFPAADQETSPAELFNHLELAPHSQLDAASTLAQLSKSGISMSVEGDLAVAHDGREFAQDDFAGLMALERGHPGGVESQGMLDGSFFDLDRFESDLSSFLLGQDAEGVDFGSMFGDSSGWGQMQV